QQLPASDGMALHDRLEGDLLALLPSTLEREALVERMARVRSVQFLMIRAGISPSFMHEAMDEDMLRRAWEYALGLQPTGVVSAGALVAGMVRTDERLSSLLPHLQLDQHDLDLVVEWHTHLQQLIAHHQQPRFTGGVGRDWSFGFTPMLERFGVNISERVAHNPMLSVDVEAHKEALTFLTQTFGSGGKQNAALIGPVGSGRTTIIQAFAESLLAADGSVPSHLKFSQVISLDAASLIAAANGRGELEELVNTLLVEAFRAKNIIICLDDAELFFEDGIGSVDISKLLQPVLEGGALRILLTMEAQKYLQIARRNPALAQSLNRLTIAPASYDETMRIAQDQLVLLEFQKKVTYMYQALRESYRLSERYLYDIAQPGKSLQLLEAASQYADNGLVTAASVQRAIEQTQGVKVGANVTNDDKETLLNLEARIHERMINQTRAVTVVSDALRRARAGVRNEKRPIGTF
ncbi:MAG TPA: AAA family ATPase, partial [Candidatus Saccharibacteria bacterium]|nr:AAA family ATPase [Candidatus Saccharibacteria bacterium]